MPSAIDYRRELEYAVQQVKIQPNLVPLVPCLWYLIISDTLQIVQAPSDNEYFNQLLPAIKDASKGGQGQQLLQSLAQYSANREAEIERICNTNHQGFVSSVNQLLHVREGTVNLTSEVLQLNQSIQSSTEKLAEQKKALVDSRGVRQNIDEATQALRDCLEVLRLANQVHDLLGKKSHYSALRALDELQNVHLKEITQYKIAEMIQKSVPATKKLIAEAVMTDLKYLAFPDKGDFSISWGGSILSY